MSPIKFEIESFVGALPLRFGMSPDEVVSVIGEPRTRSTHLLGGLNLDYYAPGLDVSVGFDKESGLAAHFGFGRLSSIRFKGFEVFDDPTAWQSIVRMSSDCHKWVGLLILCDLGIQLSGFHDNDPNQLGIVAFPQGRYDHQRHKFKPFNLP
jgi:hypothetical protein